MSSTYSMLNMPGNDGLEAARVRKLDLAATCAGDREAMARLVAPYSPNLYRSALRLTRNPADAEDVRQETLLKVLLRVGQFTGKPDAEHDDLRAWISRIAVNSSIDLIRRRREARNVSLEEPVGNTGDTVSLHMESREENPEERFARRQTRLLFAQAIRGLAPELRRVCLLRDVLQYSTQEVAERLGISTVAVRLRLFRAHSKLREILNAKRKAAAIRKQQASGRAAAEAVERFQQRQERFLPLTALPQCVSGD